MVADIGGVPSALRDDVHLAACCEIERPAEPVSASVVDIVSLWRAFLPLYLSPPMDFGNSAQNTYQRGV